MYGFYKIVNTSVTKSGIIKKTWGSIQHDQIFSLHMTKYSKISSTALSGFFPLQIWQCKAALPSIKRTIILSILFLLVISDTHAQQSISYTLHANIIYRFTKYIEWPDYNKPGDFVIGITGDTELYDELEHFVENKTVGNKKIVVKKISSAEDYHNCQIVFISEDKSKYLKKITEITKGTPTLIVSESDGLASKGSCINFVIVNEHLKLEINKNNILEHNLNIANELLSLGAIVK
jgi:hypothetical protein